DAGRRFRGNARSLPRARSPRRPGPLPPPGRPGDRHHHRPHDHLHPPAELAAAGPRRHHPGRGAPPPPAHLRPAPRRPRPGPRPLPLPRLRIAPHRPAPHPVLEQRRPHPPGQPHQPVPPPPPHLLHDRGYLIAARPGGAFTFYLPDGTLLPASP